MTPRPAKTSNGTSDRLTDVMPANPGPSTVLNPLQVARWLQIEPRQIERFGIPALEFGHKTRRYLYSDVTTWLAEQRSTRSRQ
jgi:hypothetical protein